MTALWDDMQPPVATNNTQWLVTFADLVALLLVFFVLLFSMKEVNRERWEELTGSFQGVFAPRDAVVWVRPDNFNNAEREARPKVSDALVYLDKLLQRRMADDVVWSQLQAEITPDGKELRYRLPDTLLAQGVDEEARTSWIRLAAMLRNWDNPLVLRVVSPLEGMAEPLALAANLRGLLAANGVEVLQAGWQMPRAGMAAGVWLVVGGAP